MPASLPDTQAPQGASTAPEGRCSVCGGPLIGGELKYGSCGHCGGRSLRPKRAKRETVATVTLDHQPTGEDLDWIEATYREEGFVEPTAIAVPTTDRAKTWTVQVIAISPYRGRPS